VQETLLRALTHLDEFEPHHPGAFLAYLRQILLNQVRDRIRKAQRTPGVEPLAEDVVDLGPSPLELTIGREKLEAFERALARLSPVEQEAVVLRIEMGFTHEQVAQAIGSPSANAARMLVARALVRVAAEMNGDGA
jgi:RNA polymerase sigma-70 factor, ECF subfamily